MWSQLLRSLFVRVGLHVNDQNYTIKSNLWRNRSGRLSGALIERAVLSFSQDSERCNSWLDASLCVSCRHNEI